MLAKSSFECMSVITELMQKIPLALALLLSAVGTVGGDYLAKSWSLNLKTNYFILALVFYFAAGLFYAPTLLKEKLVITSVIWSVLSIIGFLFVGLVIFRETLTSIQILGVVLGVLSLIILAIAQ